MSDRETVIKELNEEYERFFGLLMTLNEEEKTQVMLGTWSVREIVVHMVGWFRQFTASLERTGAGERSDPEAIDYSDGDATNARFVEESKGKSPGQLEAELHAAKDAFVAGIRGLPEGSLAQGKTARRMVDDMCSDFREHGDQIREWKSRTGVGRPIPSA